MSRRYWLRSGTVIPAEQKIHPSGKPSCRMAVCGLQRVSGGGVGGGDENVKMGKMSAYVKDGRTA